MAISLISKNNNTFWAFAAGAAIGAALGILYAPDKGKNTRDKLSFQLEKYREKLKEIIEQIMDGKDTPMTSAKFDGEHVVKETKAKAEELLSDVETLIDQIRGVKRS